MSGEFDKIFIIQTLRLLEDQIDDLRNWSVRNGDLLLDESHELVELAKSIAEKVAKYNSEESRDKEADNETSK
jgi:hypothetical protein